MSFDAETHLYLYRQHLVQVTTAARVESVDVVPTLMELLGPPVPTFLEGRSLASLLRGHGRPVPSVGALTEARGWKSLRTPGHRYLVHDDGHESLWDLVADPSELEDVADAHPDVVASLRNAMLTKLLSTERARPRTYAY